MGSAGILAARSVVSHPPHAGAARGFLAAISNGVQWVVTEPVTVSDEDIAQFAAQVTCNARYTQRDVPARPAKN